MKTGYTALSSVIIIGVVLSLLGTAITLSAINFGQSSLANRTQYTSLNNIETCVEDALLTLNTTNSLPSAISSPSGNCTVILNSQIGTSWDFTVSSVTGSKNIRLKLNRSSSISVSSWQEL